MTNTVVKAEALVSPAMIRVWKWLVFGLALTGFAQMPIFKRYYIADIPGMGWLADFYLTNILHYILAAVFLYITFNLVTRYITVLKTQFAVTSVGIAKFSLIGLIIVTGIFRVLKNEPNIFFSPTTTLLIDWIHLFSVIIWGVLSLTTLLLKKRNFRVITS
ncbi:hypothetical protein [Desulfovibrio inopinatus]|uniref:hypothetical protein n=1 Tax=Desulfovibrio inopinatus TaxID=102109 RepID=UPI000423F572|nr:hypothetical protein [Desulfovibrio inopinatus]